MIRRGSCQCGSVTLQITGEPIGTFECWCRACQRMAAGSPAHNAFFNSADVAVSGTLKWYEVVPDSGSPLARAFCPECATHLFARPTARPELTVVRIGVLDDSTGLEPKRIVWASEAPPWAHFDPALPRTERQ